MFFGDGVPRAGRDETCGAPEKPGLAIGHVEGFAVDALDVGYGGVGTGSSEEGLWFLVTMNRVDKQDGRPERPANVPLLHSRRR